MLSASDHPGDSASVSNKDTTVKTITNSAVSVSEAQMKSTTNASVSGSAYTSQALATSGQSGQTIQSVPPVFLKERDIQGITPIQLCNAIVSVISDSKLEGVQKVNNIWRVYLKDRQTRLELSVKESIIVNGQRVRLYDTNPNVVFSGYSHNQRFDADKLTIKNLPLSVSNNEIAKMLREKNVQMISPIRYGYIRDADGQLTDYKSGDRYVYVQPYDQPLPKQQEVGIFKCILIHHGKETECKACKMSGHKIGADTCKAKPTDKILAFKGYHHPLSNHFPCELRVYGKTFSSVEHAFFWYMAVEMGQEQLAERIRTAKHAGEAKRLSKDIAEDTERWNWEERNFDVMQYLLEEKAQQCTRFRQCLVENKDFILAEATPSKLWATGLSPFVTEHTAPPFWPGKNLLGSMLTEMAQQLSSRSSTDSPMPPSESVDPQHPPEATVQSSVESSVESSLQSSMESSVQSSLPNQDLNGKPLDQDNAHTEVNNAHAESPVNSVQLSVKHVQTSAHTPEPSSGGLSHQSRPKHRSPVAPRTTRSFSPIRRRYRPSTPKPRKNVQTQQDIRNVFPRTENTPNKVKRKEQASSPDEADSVSKVHKADNDVH